MQKKLTIAAAIFIFVGFGLIHNPKQNIEYMGSALIGVGSLYLIFVLIAKKRSFK